MHIEQFRDFCLSLPHVSEDLKWENVLCFCIAEKIFATIALDHQSIAFKVNTRDFEELTAKDGFRQAPHFKKGQWIMINNLDLCATKEIEALIKQSYQLIFEKLPKKTQANFIS